MNQSYKRLIVVLIVFIILVIGFKQIQKYLHQEAVFPRISGFEVHGIDVSHHQKRINWYKVKQDSIDFVFMKATEGKDFRDPNFELNWRSTKEKNIIRGAYHFYRPSIDAEVQAKHFIRTVKLSSGDFPPVLDLEVSDNRPKRIVIEGAKNWLTIIEKHYGIKPILYVNRNWFEEYVDGNFDDYVVWMAAYTVSPQPKLVNGKDWIFWQYTNRGRVNGINGAVDLNVFSGSKEALKQFIIP